MENSLPLPGDEYPVLLHTLLLVYSLKGESIDVAVSFLMTKET